jgi:hypothetical protein
MKDHFSFGQAMMFNTTALCAPFVSEPCSPKPLVFSIERATFTRTIAYFIDLQREAYREKAVMNNYFGIGLDAKVCLEFHHKRKEHPEKCKCVLVVDFAFALSMFIFQSEVGFEIM